MSILDISLKDRVAVVTGAAGIRGIGRAIAIKMAAAGADVAVCDLKVKEKGFDLEDTANEIRKLGRRAMGIKVDISNENEVDTLFSKVSDEFGTVDILVNNAAILVEDPLLNMTGSLWDRVMAVNLKGAVLCSKQAAKIMIENKSEKGNIINIASTAGMRGAPPNSAYGTSKAAVIHVTRWLAQELAPHGIRVNAVAPGPIVTDIYRDIEPGQREMIFEEIKKRIPLNTFSEPFDIANMALFLVSDAARNITGQCIIVDGGLSLH